MYTYAFLKTPAEPLELPIGIENPVQVVNQNGIAAVVEPDLILDGLRDDTALMQAVLSHDRVIRELFLQTTILPLRFGTSFISLQGLLTHLDANQPTYLEKLTQFEGKAEYPLKFIPLSLPEIPISSEMKGKEYFLAKKNQYQTQLEHQKQQQDEVNATLRMIAQAYSQFVTSEAQSEVETIYLLSDRQKESQLHQAFRIWQEQCPSWQMTLGEALPPYHFLSD
ncbi:GvpL/GvpF family gas vesicle protein [Kovacikia minuta CCNUW1]|uniref:GvpL/GvpF family gas vesicle protein n=1 Tax=Kovacikia minuta TaxID=2931930 RepID=UPI001CCCC96B|nr:GvpL/GvpF family gas vesicle protein [Kovacikia minuta]UBF26725.1 GvpL/GvpF family gas vesicle protein [Kovacikia minuta CCNUW1]